MYKPKFRLKQKVACYKQNDGKMVYGRIIGMRLFRSYSRAGLFQNGGMFTADIEKKGFVNAYCDDVDNCEYAVLFEDLNGGRHVNNYTESTLIKLLEEAKE